jgi:hypothetical protein
VLRIQIALQQQDRCQFVYSGLPLFYRRVRFPKDTFGCNARQALVPVDNRDTSGSIQTLGKFGSVRALAAIFSTHVQRLSHEE